MTDVWYDKEIAQEVVNRLTSFDVIKLLFVNMDVIERNDDGSITMKHRELAEDILGNAVDPLLPYDAEEVLKHYNSEDVIVLLDADLALINTVHADLGLPAEGENFVGPSGKLEAYGLARIETPSGLKNYFSYVVPKLEDLASPEIEVNDEDAEEYIESEDLTIDYRYGNDGGDVKPEVLPESTLRNFQIDRWVRFLQWMGDMAAEAQRTQAKAAEYEARAAADDEVDLAKIADAQKKDFDVSVYYKVKIWGYLFPVDRVSSLKYEIYSAHSFTYGNDFYLVNLEASTNLKGFLDTYIDHPTEPGKYKYHANYLLGYTRAVEFEHHIDDGKMSTDDVSLSHHAPVNFKNTKTQSNSETWSLEGTLGFSGLSGTGEVGYGKSHTNELSWEVSEFEIKDQCETDYRASAKWRIDMELPDDGAEHSKVNGDSSRSKWWGVNAKENSKTVRDDKYAWLWTVSKSYWQNHPDLQMNVVFKSTDGSTYGKTKVVSKGTRGRYDGSFTKERERSLALDPPPHVVASTQNSKRPQNIIVEPKGGDSDFGFLCNNDWTIESDSDWCMITSDRSGSDTGGTLKSTTLRIAARPFVGTDLKSVCEAVVTVRENRTNGDTAKIIVQQNAPHILVSTTSLTAYPEGGKMSFNLLSDNDWTVESDSDWCVVDPADRAGPQTLDGREINFTVKAGSWSEGDATTRQAVITAKNLSSGESVRIYVKQPKFAIDVSNHEIGVTSKGGNNSFKLRCDTNWTAESDSDWCVLSEKSGTATGTSSKDIAFTVAPLTSGLSERKATIIVKQILSDGSTGSTAKVEVAQSVIIVVDKASFHVNHKAQTQSFILHCDTNWTVESGADWCTIEPSCRSGGDTGENGKQITFSLQEYSAMVIPRSTTITVKAVLTDGSTVERQVFVIQQAY